MSETIGEMIIPGTYIEVRSEGLIGVSGIGTGNVGVVGTANRGPVDQVRVLGSYAEALETFGSYDAWPAVPADVPKALTLVRALEQAFRGGANTVYAVRVADTGDAAMASTTWVVQTGAAKDAFTLTATSPGTWANAVQARLETEGSPATSATLTLTLGRVKESFSAATAEALAAQVNEGSRFVAAGAVAAAEKSKVPSGVAAPTAVTTDGSPIGTAQLAGGLALLANQPVNIVVAGGFDAKTAAGTVLAHLEATENDGRERIAVLGASTDTPADIISNDSSKGSNPRLVLVAPGIVADDAARTGANRRVRLPAPYAAALVAGKMSTLAPHVSLTNKDVPADGLTREYTRAEQKQLLGSQVMVLVPNLGIRVLKGITTDTGAFRQVSVRRVVDYAKAGVRLGSNPYIGRLNNVRVRAALKATLDGFLSGMVLDEMLTGYTLDVSATRAQEITGQAVVTMTLQPTFSIDFVKVIMNLQ
ncbi:MAG: phage tail sheath C-terminal domain-containing protein [Longimicrobiaceae bacterium]